MDICTEGHSDRWDQFEGVLDTFIQWLDMRQKIAVNKELRTIAALFHTVSIFLTHLFYVLCASTYVYQWEELYRIRKRIYLKHFIHKDVFVPSAPWFCTTILLFFISAATRPSRPSRVLLADSWPVGSFRIVAQWSSSTTYSARPIP